ncbi:Holliday junction ATP-dependent DNA helicase RuvA [candidate division SR1 bacterium]|nr:Holliday junction ATP-dependent DNA helicase RuvA [candidate division SR1 bacterium]
MFHYFLGKICSYGAVRMLQNDQFGIQIQYQGKKAEGEFFLYPYLDDNKKTVLYYAFDTVDQKQLFESLLKINGIGAKTALIISNYNYEDLKNAVHTMDVKFFQSIPGIGPKSAKKIILEMKGTIDLRQVSIMDMDQKLMKDIVKSLKNFGYDVESVKNILTTYDGKITKENMGEVIKWVITQL